MYKQIAAKCVIFETPEDYADWFHARQAQSREPALQAMLARCRHIEPCRDCAEARREDCVHRVFFCRSPESFGPVLSL